MTYRKYDPAIKQMIIKTQNPSLFPELGIPRTTALYWINKSKEPTTTNFNSNLTSELERLQNEIIDQRAINLALTKLTKALLCKCLNGSLASSLAKSELVNIVEEMSGLIPVKSLIELLGISKSAYYRLRQDNLGCPRDGKLCDYSANINHVSVSEQRRMLSLATDERYAQLSIKSLMYYAQREKIVFRGLDSWYKYLKLNKVHRPWRQEPRRKRYLCGLRAKMKNEIWHIDITEIKTLDGNRHYVQIVMDNYSRAILSWKISPLKDMSLTLKSLEQSFENMDSIPNIVLSDCGRENRNCNVQRLLIGRGIIQLIAKSDIRFSNSMIESVFRQFKKNPKVYKLATIADLECYLANFVHFYNKVAPHASLFGATPGQVLNDQWNLQKFKDELEHNRRLVRASTLDIKANCGGCQNEIMA